MKKIIRTCLAKLNSLFLGLPGKYTPYHLIIDAPYHPGQSQKISTLFHYIKSVLEKQNYKLIKEQYIECPRGRTIQEYKRNSATIRLIYCMDFGLSISSKHIDIHQFLPDDFNPESFNILSQQPSPAP